MEVISEHSMSKLDDPNIYRAVLESLPTGVYVVDEDRRIVFWNDGAERITGFLRQEVVGRFCRDNILVHCDADNSVLCGTACPLADTMHDGRSREVEVYLRHKDGFRVPVRVRAVPIRDQEGLIIGAAEIFEERAIAPDPNRGLINSSDEVCVEQVTGLPGQDWLLARLSESLAQFTGQDTPFGILRIRLDQLMDWHSRGGQQVVNVILRAVGQTLRSIIPPTDLVGRWSEGEFLAIVANCDSGHLEKLGAQLKKIVNCVAIKWWGDYLPIKVSLGSAEVSSGDTPESLLERAEESLGQSLTP
jgi:PAS domain S-box-containing protein/diguanylate cyclase (GGDEF)-like protein